MQVDIDIRPVERWRIEILQMPPASDAIFTVAEVEQIEKRVEEVVGVPVEIDWSDGSNALIVIDDLVVGSVVEQS